MRTRRSQAEAEAAFREMVAVKGGEIVGEYAGTRAKIRLRCRHGHEWDVRPFSVIAGNWCPTCGGRTPEGAAEKLKRIVEANGGMVFDEYAGSQVKLGFRCRHGHEWRATPNSVISGTWCRKCSRMKTEIQGAARPTRPSPKVEARLSSVVAAKGGEIVGEYQGTSASVRLRCRHGHEWEPRVASILYRGCWCPHCSRQSPEDGEARFLGVVKDRGGSVLGSYVNMRTKVGLRCRHGHEWEATPTCIIQGNWCPTCYRNSGTERLREILEAKGGRMLDDYSGSQVKVRFRCRSGHEWLSTPNHVVNGGWCPECRKIERRVLKPILKRIEAFQAAAGELTPSRLRCGPAGRPAGSLR